MGLRLQTLLTKFYTFVQVTNMTYLMTFTNQKLKILALTATVLQKYFKSRKCNVKQFSKCCILIIYKYMYKGRNLFKLLTTRASKSTYVLNKGK